MYQLFMSVDFVAFGLRFFVTNPSAVVLSVCAGVAGCLWPISFSRFLAGIAWRVLMKRALISASAADVTTFLMICAMLRMAPLFYGNSALSDM